MKKRIALSFSVAEEEDDAYLITLCIWLFFSLDYSATYSGQFEGFSSRINDRVRCWRGPPNIIPRPLPQEITHFQIQTTKIFKQWQISSPRQKVERLSKRSGKTVKPSIWTQWLERFQRSPVQEPGSSNSVQVCSGWGPPDSRPQY